MKMGRWLCVSLLPMMVASGDAPIAAQPSLTIGGVRLERVQHVESLLPDTGHSGFGSLLFNVDGTLARDAKGMTWLYTTTLFEPPNDGRRDWYGKWVSYARPFDPGTLASGDRTLALGLAAGERWAVIHHAIRVDPGLYIVFYSANGAVKAATSTRPDGPFTSIPGFELAVTELWEKEGGVADSLESCGGHVTIEHTDKTFVFWLLYDSYHVDATRGDLGWAKLRLEKRDGRLTLVEKHPSNPLKLRPEGYLAARAGGTAAGDVRFNGLYTLFYYTRPSRTTINLAAALSPDPLFQQIVHRGDFDGPLGTEVVIEKFQAYARGTRLHVMYENQLASGRWGTGIRVYDKRN